MSHHSDTPTSREDPHGDVRVFAGVVQDVFAGDAAGPAVFGAAPAGGEYQPEAFQGGCDFSAGRQVAAVVLEVPDSMLGAGSVSTWATISLEGHAPEQQVSRWGLPLLTHLLLADEDQREAHDRLPDRDTDSVRQQIATDVAQTCELAGTAGDPQACAGAVLVQLGGLALPCTVGAPAGSGVAGFDGRTLTDDVMDVVLSLRTDSALSSGTRPDPHRVSGEFPCFLPPRRHG